MVKLENQKNQNKGLKKSKLTKEDSSSESEQSDIDIQEEIEKLAAAQKVVSKPQKEDKRKQPRTEAQLKHFENMRIKRQENIEKEKLNKKIEASKVLLENDLKVVPKKEKKVVKKVVEESSDEEEVIIIEKKKKKPKQKRIIIEESSSEEEEEPEKQQEEMIKRESRKFKSQQNKKSIIKINNNTKPEENKSNDFSKFFV
jgi:predicted DNA-binding protein (UPF0251 family)